MIDPKIYSLIKVSETGNFSKAAEQLALTQPAVSQHIRALEEELKIKIFERVGKELRITSEGASALKYAKQMVAIYHNLQRELESEKTKIRSLTIGITHTAESNAIAESLAQYVTSHDGVSIKIQTGISSNLYDMLKHYELDFAILEGKVNDPNCCSLMLDTDCLVVALSTEHPLAKKNVISINDLKKERLILRLPDSSTRNLFAASLESQNLSVSEFNVVLEIDNIATIKDLVRRNFGVSVLARSACLDELKKGKIVCLPIENLGMIREINIVYLKTFEHPDLLQDIVQNYNENRT